MYVEPVRTISPGRSSKARVIAGVALPIVGLILVVAAGALAHPAAPPPQDREAVVPEMRPRIASPVAASDERDFPQRAARLGVRTVEEVLELRRADQLGGELVAVSAWLTRGSRQPDCLAAGEITTSPDLCRRVVVLTDSPSRLSTPGRSASPRWRGPHLHAQVLPGTSLGAFGQPRRGAIDAEPVPVVALGRFDDPRAEDCLWGRHCGESFVLERLVWVDGAWPLVPVVTSEIRPGGVESSAVRFGRLIVRESARSPIVLTQALVGREWLPRIDPLAAEAVEGRDADTVWYFRMIGRQPSTLRWAVADERGRILASGDLEVGHGAGLPG
ncbi:MAG TPA: hypothetical protein VGQ58_11475 [Candidatus Limnocylindrales bacterium]|jgi:hypothetical protein|nr:hypothetical protein [Candidatus Limnocylindrales bacterium]